MTPFERLKCLREWFNENVDPDAIRMDVWHNDTGCGTEACLAGWACECPELIAEGLSYSSKSGSIMYQHPGCDVAERMDMEPGGTWEGLAKFFGLAIQHSHTLFGIRQDYDDLQDYTPALKEAILDRLDQMIEAYKDTK